MSEASGGSPRADGGRGVDGPRRASVDWGTTGSVGVELIGALVQLDVLDAAGPRVAHDYLDIEALESLFDPARLAGGGDHADISVTVAIEDATVTVSRDGVRCVSREPASD